MHTWEHVRLFICHLELSVLNMACPSAAPIAAPAATLAMVERNPLPDLEPTMPPAPMAASSALDTSVNSSPLFTS